MTTGIKIEDMADLGTVTDSCSVVADSPSAGSGRFSAPALRVYVNASVESQIAALQSSVSSLTTTVNDLQARLAVIEPVYIRVD